MTTTKSTGGTSAMAADSTNSQRNMQQRITAFISEVSILKTELKLASDDYMALLRDFEAEKEARTNVQFERDAVALKLKAFGVLLRRVLDADAGCTGEAYAQLINDICAALGVTTEGQ